MKRLLAVTLAALAVPAGAAAKELKTASVCGAEGCTQVQDKRAFVVAFEDGGPPAPPPAKPAAFYRVHIQITGDPATETLLVAPGANRVRGFDGVTWFSIPARNRPTWVAVTRGIRPFPAAKLPDVDPNAPAPATGGALPPHTYNVADVPKAPVAAVHGGGGLAWWVPAGIGALLAALAAGYTVRRVRRGHGDSATA